MRTRLLLFFVAVPLLDLASLAWLSWQTHWTVAMAAVIAAGGIGGYLIRWAGPRRTRATAERIVHGAAPLDALVDVAALFVAGVLFISPGILSDVAALVVLIPPLRRLIYARLSQSIRQRIIRSVSVMAMGEDDRERFQGEIIDVESWSYRFEDGEK